MDIFSNEEIEKLSNQESLIQTIYKNKYLQPGKVDILNGMYELGFEALASLIHRYWNEGDVTFGHQIRERFKQDFLEVVSNRVKDGKLTSIECYST